MGMENVEEKYTDLTVISEGAYGIVYRAKRRNNQDSVVALKRLSTEKTHVSSLGFSANALREIRILSQLSNDPKAPESIVKLLEIVVGNTYTRDLCRDVYLVFEYCEHDLGKLLDTMERPFTESQVKGIFVQLLEAVSFLHSEHIIHRDIKMSNILYNSLGKVKLCDFGFARFHTEFTSVERYTPLVVTLWYRAPELLLGSKIYGAPIDNWALGCVLGELMLHRPLLAGSNEVSQVRLIFELLGFPNEDIWPGWVKLPLYDQLASDPALAANKYNKLQALLMHIPREGIELLNLFLNYDPKHRLTAEHALHHEYLNTVPPLPSTILPTFPSTFSQQK
mmetsp:Transcript_28855/g.35517  ORF Transcript_28855/g.35517 Transcript_28855/m.35517 type:complete len:337 (+) Transcript_28855:273-1283(+)